MFTGGWIRRRRHVDRLSRFVQAKRNEEIHLRRGLKASALGMFARIESMLWIGTAGAVWAVRMKDAEGRERKQHFIELIAAAMVALRWKQIAGYITSRWSDR